jgi:hypothetical protein
MTNTLGNLPPSKQVALIRRLSTVLRPGGRLYVSVYSDGSEEARVHSYERIGLHVEVRGDRVLAAQGLKSETFTTLRLRTLLEENGLRVIGSVEQTTPISLAAVAERPARL